MLRSVIRCSVLAGVVGLAACELEVVNPNDPETRRVLATPADVEALLGDTYKRWHSGLYGTLSSVHGQVAVLSLENYSSLANNGMGAVVSIPRSVLNNAVGNGFATEHRRVYYIPSEAARTASNVLAKLDEAGFTLGTGGNRQDLRARAFAEFVRGISLGYVALYYDSGAVVHPGLGPEEPGELVGHQELMAAAIGALDAAIAAAISPAEGPAAEGFPLPENWLPSNTNWTADNFVRLIRSYRARLRANVARTPAERAQVDWDAVIADAQNGITDDHFVLLSTTVGPTESWRRQWVGGSLWHQMTPFIMGMADVTGSYASWIGLNIDDRGATGPFFMQTPDVRFPQGVTRAEQQADFNTPCVPVPCKRYFRNRPTGNDNTSGSSWGFSNYDFVRFHPFLNNGASEIEPGGRTAGNGFLPYFTKAELNMLEAEGHFRKGAYAQAAALVNITRVANGGLPAITVFDATSPVPGGAGECVPKMPVNAINAGGGTVTCGNLWEALKYEKRIESMYTHFGPWYLDGRGWGDLPEDTGLHWAPPYEDLQARGQTATVYSTGGGGPGSAARSGYGW